ncbi:MAG: hypothetical protein V8T64_05515 [Roseburia intestinalis]
MGKNKRKRSHTKHVFVQKKYRDALFRRIFNEKSVLMELYNALNQTDYDDADELIFYTIDDVIYLGYKNDVSFIVRGTLNLYEHQSTLNPNMPIRGLIYFGKQYESYIKQHNLNIYGKKCFRCRFRSLLYFIMGLNRWKMAKIIWNCIFRMHLYVPDQITWQQMLHPAPSAPAPA